eukprot:gene34517-biopygen32466
MDFSLEISDDKDTRVKDLLQRAQAVRRLMVHAGCSLEVAQHRDTLHYEGRRGGGYEPKPHQQFKVGDFVYIWQKPRSGMEVATKAAILKLVKIHRDGTRMQAANAEVQTQETKVSCVLEDRLGMKEQQLSEKLSPDMRLLPADVGPRRVVKGSKFQPWQAISSREMMLEEKDLFLYMPDQVDWGRQDKLSGAVRIFMPGHWNEGHRTVLSKKYREQKAIMARQLRDAPLVPALGEEEIEKRGELRHMTRAQVREASVLQWGLELVITVPSEVRRLATEVDWKSIDGVWDPWAGTGVISEVMVEQWPHLRFMNNDWNPQLAGLV